MMIRAINQCDLNRVGRTPQRLGGKKSTETQANDHDDGVLRLSEAW